MNIAIQAADLDAARIDGTRVYLKELLKRFGTLASETDFSIYHRGVFNPALAPPAFPNYRVRSLPFPVSWMQTRFACEMFRARPDRLFLPIQAAPRFIPRGLEVTATIHDLAFKRYPETFPARLRFKLNFLLATVLRRADRLIAVSHSTKRDILEFFPDVPADRITVIHHGFDAEFFGMRENQAVADKRLETFGLARQGYCLYVGALQPRKNLERLIAAFEQARRTRSGMRLVLAGEAAWLADGILAARERSPYRADIVLAGRVSFDQLRTLYQCARSFAFPSLYEGFGLPILEAFASRVPVLTADNSSLGEVAGTAALLCQAEDAADMAEKLGRLWDDEVLREELVRRGTERLTAFSWDRSAEETLAVVSGHESEEIDRLGFLEAEKYNK